MARHSSRRLELRKSKSQIEWFKEAARDLEIDIDVARSKARPGNPKTTKATQQKLSRLHLSPQLSH